MAAEPNATTRWWENYLVRYFLPSIAGMLILAALLQINHTPPSMLFPWIMPSQGEMQAEKMLSSLNLQPIAKKPGAQAVAAPATRKIGAQRNEKAAHESDGRDNDNDSGLALLALWILLGTLYCYLASYPCLVFHATRALDFKDVTGNSSSWLATAHFVSLLFLLAVGEAAWFDRLGIGFLAAGAFTLYQLWRIGAVYHRQRAFGFTRLAAKTSLAYAYACGLAKQRAHAAEAEIQEGDDEEIPPGYRADLAESYRHLREHGNTAFILLLELALAPLLYLILQEKERVPLLAALLVLWILPSVGVHWLAQHLERRFSLFSYPVAKG